MNTITWIVTTLITGLLAAGLATAQPDKEGRKSREKSAVVAAKKAKVADKDYLKRLRSLKKEDKLYGSKRNVREDRKAIRKAHDRVRRDELKKDVARNKNVLKSS